MIVGFVSSVTVTICVVVAVFPAPSVTVQVTVVSPSSKAVGASLVVEATEQLSLVVADPKETSIAVHPSLVETLTASGAVIVGFVSSVTVTVAVHCAEFPLTSVTVSTTEFSPKLEQLNVLISIEIEPIPNSSVELLSIWEACIVTSLFTKLIEISLQKTDGGVASSTTVIVPTSNASLEMFWLLIFDKTTFEMSNV